MTRITCPREIPTSLHRKAYIWAFITQSLQQQNIKKKMFIKKTNGKKPYDTQIMNDIM